jgi:hypothetical protein
MDAVPRDALCRNYPYCRLLRPDAVPGTRCAGTTRTAGCPRGVTLLQPPHDGRFDRARRRPDKLAHLFQLVHDVFALNAELFGELIDSDLGHLAVTPSHLSQAPGSVIITAERTASISDKS